MTTILLMMICYNYFYKKNKLILNVFALFLLYFMHCLPCQSAIKSLPANHEPASFCEILERSILFNTGPLGQADNPIYQSPIKEALLLKMHKNHQCNTKLSEKP